MRQLVDDTLEVSRVEATGLQVDLHPQEVEALVSDPGRAAPASDKARLGRLPDFRWKDVARG